VWVVDDDETIASVVSSYLERGGHTPAVFSDGRRAVGALAGGAPDLVVLDVMLPGLDGRSICRLMHEALPQLPVIMLTALGEASERIAGLEAGADDYLPKPFSPRELVLRVESLLRRANAAAPPPSRLEIGDIVVDRSARRAWRGTHELDLTVREYDLLAFLLAHPGTAFRRKQLMQEVWGWTWGDDSTVTVHVRRLREKIEDDPGAPKLISTVWGVGYRLEAGQDAVVGLPG
jgi:DNA-binding response OmpR family regulator